RRAAASEAGVPAEASWLAPGIGVGKTLAPNLAVLRALPRLARLGRPRLLGASRTRMRAALDRAGPADARRGGSLALALWGARGGVRMLRVHDVAATRQALAVFAALEG
ncbi:MAG: dihydropteroate synthase, partial [Alphaproteobacteria bacterium]|nr:dihydropteroate synthase [Alphaproteobacteria bacterium]